MGILDNAEEKFEDAVFAYEQVRKNIMKRRFFEVEQTDMQKFQEIVIDLDAAIPGLEGGLILGGALLLKAECLHWIYLGSVMDSELNQSSQDTDRLSHESLFSQGLQLALKGKEILVSDGAGENYLSWADSILENFRTKD